MVSFPKNAAPNPEDVGKLNAAVSKLMEEIQKQMPAAKAIYVEKTEDPRDYRVNCDKIKTDLGFAITKKVPDGIREIMKLMNSGMIIDAHSQKFRNI